MRNYGIFLKKEFLESHRSFKWWVVLIVFAMLGLMSPLIAKFTPEIIRSTVGTQVASTIPEPTSLDSWTQFYKNIGQIGLLVLTLLFSGSVSGEITKGILIQPITKGLSRQTILFAKGSMMVIQWTLGLIISFLITWGYTAFYFPDNKSPHLFLAVVPLWVFGLLLIGCILFSSTAARTSYDGLLYILVFIVFLFILQLFDSLKYGNPISLSTENLAILQHASDFHRYWPAMLCSVLGLFLFLGGSVSLLNRKRL